MQACLTWMRAYDTTAEAGTFNPGNGAMLDTDDVAVFLGVDVGKSGSPRPGAHPGRKKGPR
ncbi:hypothetical protein GCM10010269_48590 [Streptomyces humidus]|uniref:Uncharacterized protein n=1 Tax=Streptomyces humidus TaxID=52259 RepID=A0A918L520_9ACTN|nr:hypothetical protein GCM10010269_48590 [Streptomyces humidus]